ncbi:DapH/DapD/GlmU-related protein [Streptococcus marmotae]|uniref:DapH/DapD/GlmU-related protein n=1 Tax=Streptococcus marmotae TaxID=1825069 RepID=UPI000A99A7B8
MHLLEAENRSVGLEYGEPITIGDNIWIGEGAMILVGVVLGGNAVVGPGSVVTKSFGDNVIVANQRTS